MSNVALGSLNVTSRIIILRLLEELRLVALPVPEGVDGCSARESGLGELAVIEADVELDRLLEVLG